MCIIISVIPKKKKQTVSASLNFDESSTDVSNRSVLLHIWSVQSHVERLETSVCHLSENVSYQMTHLTHSLCFSFHHHTTDHD